MWISMNSVPDNVLKGSSRIWWTSDKKRRLEIFFLITFHIGRNGLNKIFDSYPEITEFFFLYCFGDHEFSSCFSVW